MPVCTGNCDKCVNGGDVTPIQRGALLIFACSGGGNLSEIADQVARGLMDKGWGSMYCLTGLAAEIPGMPQTVRNSRLNLLLDGCNLDCARKLFEKLGLQNYRHVRISDLGFQKTVSRRATAEDIAAALQKVHTLLTDDCPGASPPMNTKD